MFSTISSFQVDKTPTPLFTNPNVSLFLDEILAYDSSSSLSQPTASPKECPPAMELTDSSSIVPSSSYVPPPPQLHRSSCVSQPSILLRDYVCNSTIVTYELRTYRKASSNPLWQKNFRLSLVHILGIWLICPPNKSMVGCNGFIKSRLMQMDLFNLWPKALQMSMALIIRRPLLQ